MNEFEKAYEMIAGLESMSKDEYDDLILMIHESFPTLFDQD